MASYIVPQVLINQLISEVPLNTTQNQNTLVVGPQYELFRFNEEKDKTYIGTYSNATGREGDGDVIDPSGASYADLADKREIPTSDPSASDDNLKNKPVIPYPGQPAGTIPDAGYAKLYADEVTVRLFSLGDCYLLDDESTVGIDSRLRFPYALTGPRLGQPTIFYRRCGVNLTDGKCQDACGVSKPEYSSWAIVYAEGADVKPKALQRAVNPGDAIRITYTPADAESEDDFEVFQSTVVSVFESVEGSGIFDSVQLADLLPEEFVDQFVSRKVDAYAGDPRSFEVDPNGDPTQGIVTPTMFDTAEADVGPVIPDDSSDCEESGDVGPEVEKNNTVVLCAVFSDVELPRKTIVRHVWNWEPYAYIEEGEDDVYGVLVGANLVAPYSNWEPNVDGVASQYRVVSAKLYVQHRDLVTSAAGTIDSVSSAAIVEATLGTVHPDNPLAFGTYMAALNSGDRLVYYCGIPTDDLSGYNVALGKATLTDNVYMICPTTMDLSVAQAVKAHVEAMSTAQNKLWRIGFVSVEPPAYDVIYDRTNNPTGEDFYGAFMWKTPGSYEDGCRVVQFKRSYDSEDPNANTDTRFLSDVLPGDMVRIWLGNSDDDWDDTPHYTVRYVQKVLSNNALQLVKPVYVCDATACKPDMIPQGFEGKHFRMEVVRRLTATQQASYIARQSSQLATRRMYNVFPSIASNDGVQFDGSFVACAVSGLVSSVLPQQPVTNVALNGISDIPLTYQTYTKAQLDEIAAGGTFIVMQDLPNSQVYVRHQISTDYTSGNLMKSELSITKNLDSISYYLAGVFKPMIGRYNITPELVRVLRVKLTTALDRLGSDTAAGLYGPQVILDGTEILYLRQSEVNRDHVEGRVRLNLPVPFNYFDLDLEI